MATTQQGERDDSVKSALAVTKDDMAALSLEQRAAIAQRKNANIVTAQIAGTNWGKGLDAATQRAIGDWGQRHGVDVTTEIHVLGGNIYFNAQFYLNRLVDLVRTGKVLDFRQSFINADPRLEEMAKRVAPADASPAEREEIESIKAEARAELRRRSMLRIRYGVPEAAVAAVVTELVLVVLPDVSFVGVKWTPRSNSDPVGKEFPQETALTRSARRALKQCIRHLPEMIEWVEGANEDATVTLSAALAENRARTSDERAQLAANEPKLLHGAPLEETQAHARAHGIPTAEYLAGNNPVPKLSRDQLEAVVNQRDPYDERSAPAGGERTPAATIGHGTPAGDDDDNPFDERPAAAAPDSLIGRGPDTVSTGGAAQLAPDSAPAQPSALEAQPVGETLFGEVAPIEQTAEEKAAAIAAAAAAEDAEIRADELATLSATERAELEELNKRNERRRGKK